MEPSAASSAAAVVVSAVAAVVVLTIMLLSCAKGNDKKRDTGSPITDQQRTPPILLLSSEDEDDDDDDDSFVIQEETEEDELDRVSAPPVTQDEVHHVVRPPISIQSRGLNLLDADVDSRPGKRRSEIVFQMDDVDDIGGYSVVDDSPRGANGKEGLYARVIPKKTRPMSVPPERIALGFAKADGAPALPERRYSTGGVMHSLSAKSPVQQPAETHDHDLEELRKMALMARTPSAGEPEEDPNFDMATLKLILGKTDGGAGESSSTDSPEPPSRVASNTYVLAAAVKPPPTLVLSPVNEEKDPRVLARYESSRSGSYMSAVFQHTFERETFV